MLFQAYAVLHNSRSIWKRSRLQLNTAQYCVHGKYPLSSVHHETLMFWLFAVCVRNSFIIISMFLPSHIMLQYKYFTVVSIRPTLFSDYTFSAAV